MVKALNEKMTKNEKNQKFKEMNENKKRKE